MLKNKNDKVHTSISKLQAAWKGHQARSFLLETRNEYERIFNEIEKQFNTEATIEWPSDNLCLPKITESCTLNTVSPRKNEKNVYDTPYGEDLGGKERDKNMILDDLSGNGTDDNLSISNKSQEPTNLFLQQTHSNTKDRINDGATASHSQSPEYMSNESLDIENNLVAKVTGQTGNKRTNNSLEVFNEVNIWDHNNILKEKTSNGGNSCTDTSNSENNSVNINNGRSSCADTNNDRGSHENTNSCENNHTDTNTSSIETRTNSQHTIESFSDDITRDKLIDVEDNVSSIDPLEFVETSSTIISNNDAITNNKHNILTESWITDKSFDINETASSLENKSEAELGKMKENLSMELLWIGQAITSRKAYLQMKNAS